MEIKRKVVMNGKSVTLLIPRLYVEHLGLNAGDTLILRDDERTDPNDKTPLNRLLIYKGEQE